MGHKMVCLTCRKAFSTASGNQHMPAKCQECGGDYVFYNHKFRPPAKSDIKAWKVVSFLFEHGFTYQHINKKYIKPEKGYGHYILAEYPNTIIEAKDFVEKYKSQARLPKPTLSNTP